MLVNTEHTAMQKRSTDTYSCKETPLNNYSTQLKLTLIAESTKLKVMCVLCISIVQTGSPLAFLLNTYITAWWCVWEYL